MAVKARITGVLAGLILVGCGTAPQPGGFQAQQMPKVPPAGEVVEKAQEAGEAVVEAAKDVVGAGEKKKDVVPGEADVMGVGGIPAVIAFDDDATKNFFNHLKSRHSGLAGEIDPLVDRIMKLDKDRKIALKALRLQDQRHMTLSQVADQLKTWIDNPKPFLDDVRADVDQIEKASSPTVSALVEQLEDDIVPLYKAAGEPDFIVGFASSLESDDPDTKKDLDSVVNRIKGLEPARRQTLEALLWNDMKDKTVNAVFERVEAFSEDPDLFVSFMNERLDKVTGTMAPEVQAMALPDSVKAIARSIMPGRTTASR